uniref:Homing endonuclease n=1 Tax=Xanthomonas phage MK21 TaxID=3148942 RepID=A0AAU7J8B6_9CAUD
MPTKLTQDEFLAKARLVHGGRYNYTKTLYTGSKGKVCINCTVHGDFLQTPNNHLSGQGCPKCRFISSGLAKRKDQKHFLEKAQLSHGKLYDYSRAIYKTAVDKLEIICAEHGPFSMTAHNHILGRGCPKCGTLRAAAACSYDTTVFVQKARAVHGDCYSYSQCIYSGAYGKMSIQCTRHGMFEQTYNDHVNNGHGCPKCANVGPSKFETEVMEFVQSLCPDAVGNDRTVIAPKELDIYVPSAKCAIECNGVHFHSDKYKKKHEHRDKTRAAAAAGVRLIHITDADWVKHRFQMERMIKNALGKSDDLKLNARDCVVRELTVREVNAFLAQYHPQGAGGTNVTAYGLDHKVHGLCAVMTFAKDAYRRNPATAFRGENWGKWDLTRYTTAHSVRGGASKLFKHFVSTHGVDEVQSFSANDWFGGSLYPTLGFVKMAEIDPDYKVFHPKIGLRGKSTWRRTNIPVRLKEIGAKTTFDPATDKRTEWMVEDEVGAKRIWDTGKICWQWKADTNN